MIKGAEAANQHQHVHRIVPACRLHKELGMTLTFKPDGAATLRYPLGKEITLPDIITGGRSRNRRHEKALDTDRAPPSYTTTHRHGRQRESPGGLRDSDWKQYLAPGFAKSRAKLIANFLVRHDLQATNKYSTHGCAYPIVSLVQEYSTGADIQADRLYLQTHEGAG